MSSLENNYQSDEIEIDIFDIIRDVLKDWWLIIITGLAVAMCAYIFANITYNPVYTTNATFVVTSKGSYNTYDNLSTASSVANSLTNIFDSEVLKKKVASDIGYDKAPGEITAEVIPETNLFVLRVSASSPDMAFRTIKSVMDNYTSVTSHVFGNAILDLLEAPKVPMYPNNFVDIRKIMKMAFLIGAGVMAAVLAWLSIMRDNVKNEKQVMRKLDTKLFGTICHEKKHKTLRSRLRRSKKGILINSPTVSFSFAQSYKKMRAKFEYKASHKSQNVLLVTSTLENEGKSTVATNLALALAQKSKKVLLIDGDLRKPSIYKILQKEMQKDSEIGECLDHYTDLKEALNFDEASGLYLLTGSNSYPNSTEIIGNNALKEFIEISKKVLDFIIIDAPPIMATADSEILADIADVSLLVVKQSTARTKDINDAIDILSSSKSELLGCVYNNVRNTLFGYRTGYGKKKSYENYYEKYNKDITVHS